MKRYFFTIALALVALMTSAQIKKPELMVFPSDAWCIANGYYTEVDNMGKIKKVPEYQQAFQENMGLKLAVAKLNDLMAERGFPLKSLEQEIKNLEQRRMEDNLTMSKAGNEMAESPMDEVLRRAKSDIRLELSWEVKDFGPKHSLSYILEAFDAYTGKSIGAAAATGAPSFSADVDVLLEEAIVANMDNFNARLMDHFTEMQEIGREVSLDIKVFANNEAGVDLETHLRLVTVHIGEGVGGDGAVFQFDTREDLVEIFFQEVLVEGGVVDFAHLVLGVGKLVGQVAVVGEEQHAGRGFVEPADRIHAFRAEAFGDQVHHGAVGVGIGEGGDEILGFVHHQVDFLLALDA